MGRLTPQVKAIVFKNSDFTHGGLKNVNIKKKSLLQKMYDDSFHE